MRSLALAISVVILGACTVKVDADKGRFSCKSVDDCGLGFECLAQESGGSLCFKKGECDVEERCNGIDDNCNGSIDETFPESGEACSTEKLGLCTAGKRVCETGALGCKSTLLPSAEVCNSLDDDCDGQTDETFDVMTDAKNCGRCEAQCLIGNACVAGTCRESVCFDGFDNDGNGKIDCDDDNCLGLECSTGVTPASNCAWVLRVDAGVDGGLDAGLDAGPADAGEVDAGAPDAGVADAGEMDAGLSDAGVDDGGSPQPIPPRPADAGAYRLGCYAPEANCGNAFDDDGDGDTDCADSNCSGAVCATGKVCRSGQCVVP